MPSRSIQKTEDGEMADSRELGATVEATPFDVVVAGGELRVNRFGHGPRITFGIHGITASSISLLPVARRLDPSFTLVAPDLRGRRASKVSRLHENCTVVAETGANRAGSGALKIVGSWLRDRAGN